MYDMDYNYYYSCYGTTFLFYPIPVTLHDS